MVQRLAYRVLMWGIRGVFYIGWSVYAFCSLYLLYLLIFKNEEKGNIPLVLFIRNLPFMVLYVLFIWKKHLNFENSYLSVKFMYLFLSLVMWLVWIIAMYFDSMYMDYEASCQFLTYRVFI